MARVGGVNGAFASLTHSTTSGFFADFAAVEVDVAQSVENDTAYSDVANSHIGNGLPLYRINASGFLRNKQTGATPGFASVTGTTLATGGTVTATFDTGCTVGMTAIMESMNAGGGRRSPVAPVRYSFIGDGAATEAWTTS